MASCLDLFHWLNYDRWVILTAEFPDRVRVWTPCLYQELPINNCSKSISINQCDTRQLWWRRRPETSQSQSPSTVCDVKYKQHVREGKMSQHICSTLDTEGSFPHTLSPAKGKRFRPHHYLPMGKGFTWIRVQKIQASGDVFPGTEQSQIQGF